MKHGNSEIARECDSYYQSAQATARKEAGEKSMLHLQLNVEQNRWREKIGKDSKEKNKKLYKKLKRLEAESKVFKLLGKFKFWSNQ